MLVKNKKVVAQFTCARKGIGHFADKSADYMTNKGQSVVEYLMVFSIVAVITLLSICSLYPRVRQACEDAFQQAAEEILE